MVPVHGQSWVVIGQLVSASPGSTSDSWASLGFYWIKICISPHLQVVLKHIQVWEALSYAPVQTLGLPQTCKDTWNLPTSVILINYATLANVFIFLEPQFFLYSMMRLVKVTSNVFGTPGSLTCSMCWRTISWFSNSDHENVPAWWFVKGVTHCHTCWLGGVSFSSWLGIFHRGWEYFSFHGTTWLFWN